VQLKLSFSGNCPAQRTNVILKDNHLFINREVLNSLEKKVFWATVEM